MDKQIIIENNQSAKQFEARQEGRLAFIKYSLHNHQIIYLHTEVPEALEGKGVGSSLAKAALEYARANHLQVVPLCPFVAAYIRRHAEYADLVASQLHD